MKPALKFALVTLVFAIVGFALEGNGPVGAMIWPPADGPDPEGANLMLLMIMGVIEALAFGAGVAFLVFGWSWVRSAPPPMRNATLLAYLGIGWSLINWVPHTALHIHHGNIATAADYGGLVAIEYGFHATLIVAGLVIANWFVRSIMGRATAVRSASQEPAARASRA